MINRRNYADVQQHLQYRRDIHRDSQGTQDNRWSALRLLLVWADETPLTESPTIRPGFPEFLAQQVRGGERFSASTLEGMASAARSFFRWAVVAHPRRYKIPPLWVESLQAPDVPETVRERELYTVDDVRQLCSLQDESLRAQRIMAAVAMLFLSGMRAGAFVTLPICAVDVAGREIRQWTSLGVRTKNSKTATTYLLGIPDLLEIVAAWDARVRGALDDQAMWYCAIGEGEDGERCCEAVHTQSRTRSHGLRNELRWLCAQTNVDYLGPHHFRHGHVVHAESVATTEADRVAISANVMHSDPSITYRVYGRLKGDDRRERIGRLGGELSATTQTELIAQIEALLRQMKANGGGE